MNADMITLAAHAVAKDIQPFFNRRVRHYMRAMDSKNILVQRVVNVRGVVPWPKRRR